MASAFRKAVETAYKAVMKPKEGTILTVAKGGAERAAELAAETEDLEYFGAEVIRRMEEVLAYTMENSFSSITINSVQYPNLISAVAMLSVLTAPAVSGAVRTGFSAGWNG